jgi:hypothetical protein
VPVEVRELVVVPLVVVELLVVVPVPVDVPLVVVLVVVPVVDAEFPSDVLPAVPVLPLVIRPPGGVDDAQAAAKRSISVSRRVNIGGIR